MEAAQEKITLAQELPQEATPYFRQSPVPAAVKVVPTTALLETVAVVVAPVTPKLPEQAQLIKASAEVLTASITEVQVVAEPQRPDQIRQATLVRPVVTGRLTR